MFVRLALLFTIVPLIELALLIEVGKHIGVFNTIAIVILTGLLGAALARYEGFGIIARIQSELARGELPGNSLIEGALILAGALLLLTPGLLTDAIGFALLLPVTRPFFRNLVKKVFRNRIDRGEIHADYEVKDRDSEIP